MCVYLYLSYVRAKAKEAKLPKSSIGSKDGGNKTAGAARTAPKAVKEEVKIALIYCCYCFVLICFFVFSYEYFDQQSHHHPHKSFNIC